MTGSTSSEDVPLSTTSSPFGRRERRSGRTRFLLRLALTAIVVALLVRVVGWRDIGSALLDASPAPLLLMYAVAMLRVVVEATQLRHLMQKVGMPISVGRVFMASQLAALYTLTVPGELAASAAKWADLSRATGKRSLVLNAMAYNKLLLTAAPLLVGGVALLIDDPLGTRWGLAIPIGLILAITWLMISLYHPHLGALTDRFLRRKVSRLPHLISSRIGFVLESMGRIRALPFRTHVTMVAFTALGIAIGVVRFYIGMRALGIVVPLVSVLWVTAFLRLVALLPLTVANLGIRESMLVVTLSASGVPPQQAVALGLLGFSITVLMALVGAGYQFASAVGWTRMPSSEGGGS